MNRSSSGAMASPLKVPGTCNSGVSGLADPDAPKRTRVRHRLIGHQRHQSGWALTGNGVARCHTMVMTKRNE